MEQGNLSIREFFGLDKEVKEMQPDLTKEGLLQEIEVTKIAIEESKKENDRVLTEVLKDELSYLEMLLKEEYYVKE